MLLPEKTCTEIYANIPFEKDAAIKLICELVEGKADVGTSSIINSAWEEFCEIYVDENNDFDSCKSKGYSADSSAFVFFRYIIEFDTVPDVSMEKFNEALIKVQDLLSASGIDAVILND